MELLEFLKKSPTAFQTVQTISADLKQASALNLSEKEIWQLEPGHTYYVVRNDSALIAFYLPKDNKNKGFRVFAAHDDSPSFKVKENPEILVENKYVKINVERYGGMIMSTWFDRPLSVAGRLLVKTEKGIESRFVNVDQDLLIIPNVAIHMNRDINDGYKYNAQEDMLPLFGGIEKKGTFLKTVCEAAGVLEENLLAHDLFLYIREEGRIWGSDQEFVSGPHLDDLQCALAGYKGFFSGKKENHIPVYVLFDNEEVGSSSRQGAASTFLKDTLERISECLGDSIQERQIRVSDSFLISADNGHAVHPNHPEKTDPSNRPVVNGGILLKFSSNLRYTTDGFSAALFKTVAEKAGVKTQIFFNRSDMLGGSTLGNISVSQVPFASADIGLPQLAMHSSYETAGYKDYQDLIRFAEVFYD